MLCLAALDQGRRTRHSRQRVGQALLAVEVLPKMRRSVHLVAAEAAVLQQVLVAVVEAEVVVPELVVVGTFLGLVKCLRQLPNQWM